MTAAGILAILGGAIFGISTVAEQAAISAEEYRIAQEKANKVYEEYGEELSKNMSYITNQHLKDRTVGGVSQEARSTMAAYVGQQ